MNLDLTSKEMEVLLSYTAQGSIHGNINYRLWQKVSKEFARKYDEVKDTENTTCGACGEFEINVYTSQPHNCSEEGI